MWVRRIQGKKHRRYFKMRGSTNWWGSDTAWYLHLRLWRWIENDRSPIRGCVHLRPHVEIPQHFTTPLWPYLLHKDPQNNVWNIRLLLRVMFAKMVSKIWFDFRCDCHFVGLPQKIVLCIHVTYTASAHLWKKKRNCETFYCLCISTRNLIKDMSIVSLIIFFC